MDGISLLFSFFKKDKKQVKIRKQDFAKKKPKQNWHCMLKSLYVKTECKILVFFN
jgi:hypothetical protein